ncbi:MAG: hypothetical protein K6F57_03080 [Candidatus Saccharibacteria bacterium]|nr:hypothetical protein [Candidatus Saccharibacteria bacterium]
MSKKRFWNDKVRSVFYSFSLAIIIIALAYVSITEHSSLEIFSADQALPFMTISLNNLLFAAFTIAPTLISGYILAFLISKSQRQIKK